MKLHKVASAFVGIVLFAGASLAQITTLEGNVIGGDGKPYAGAIIKIHRTDIAWDAATKSDKTGHYIHTGVPLGTFDLSCLVDGKEVDKINGVKSSVGEHPAINFDLRKLTAQDTTASALARKTAEAEPVPANIYQGLRMLALQARRANILLPPNTSPISLPPAASPTTPWGVVMEWAVENATTTAVAFSDGSADIYLSTGGAFVGGGDDMRKLARRAVAVAADAQPKMNLTNFYPLPHGDEVCFYVISDAGVFMGRASREELNTTRHSFSELGNAMQELITWYQNQGNVPGAAKTTDSDDFITPSVDTVSLERRIAAYLSRKGMNVNLSTSVDGKQHAVLVAFPSDTIPGKSNVRFAVSVSPVSQDAKTQAILLILSTGIKAPPTVAIETLINNANRKSVCAWYIDDDLEIRCRALPLMVNGYSIPTEEISQLIFMSTSTWVALAPAVAAYIK